MGNPHVITGDRYVALERGELGQIPMMIGSTADERSMFVRAITAPEFDQTVGGNAPFEREIRAAYPHATGDQRLSAARDLLRDGAFGWPARAWARLRWDSKMRTGKKPGRYEMSTGSNAGKRLACGLALLSIGLSAMLVGCVAHAQDASDADAVRRAATALMAQGLRGAGASEAEVEEAERALRNRSPEQLLARLDFLRAAPADFFRTYLFGVRREALEPAPALIFGDIRPVRTCRSLGTLRLRSTRIVRAAADPDGSCRITALVSHHGAKTDVTVYVALPLRGWNGRFRGTGGAAFAGGNEQNLRLPAARGYAAAATDAGNPSGSGSFALAQEALDWPAILNNAYRGIHDMTVVGKALTRAYYGRAPRYAYFVGASTGGRQGLMEAQRFPGDYDGIVAFSPAIHRSRYVPAQLWPQLVLRDAGHMLSAEQRDAATAAAIAACDGDDGKLDQVIDDPLRCDFDPAELIGTSIGGRVFTRQNADAIRQIWDGPRTADGQFLWYGPTRGTALAVLAEIGADAGPGKPFFEGVDWFKYFLVESEDWQWSSLSRKRFEHLFATSRTRYRSIYDSDNPDLAAFSARGGKLLVFHGTADPIVPVQGSIDYFRSVERRMGADATAGFLRLFLVPGAGHGFGASPPSPSNKAAVEAIIDWVEMRRPPDSILADGLDAHGAGISRVLKPQTAAQLRTGTASGTAHALQAPKVGCRFGGCRRR